MTDHSEVSVPRRNLHLLVYPSNLVNASRIGKLARSLHAPLGFAETHVVGIRNSTLPARETLGDGITLVRLAGTTRKSILGRLLKAIGWQPKVYNAYKTAPLSVVAAHNVWVLPLCARLAHRTGAALVYNAHELETEAIAMRGVKRQIAKWIERRYIRRVALTSVVNEPIADWYQNTYPEIPRPIVVTNIPEVSEVNTHLREDLNISDGEMLYIHIGYLTHGRNIPLILRAFARHGRAHLVFFGDGVLRPEVEAAARAHQNIHWHPPVAPDLVVAHAREADVGLCLIEHVDLSDSLSSPNKLLESLAARIPPLCTDLPEVRRWLGDQADNWIIQDTEDALVGALDRVTKEDVTRFRSGWGGLPTWAEHVRPLIEAYQRIGA